MKSRQDRFGGSVCFCIQEIFELAGEKELLYTGSQSKGVRMEEVTRDQVKISVRNLVEFILRSGDLDNRKDKTPDKNAMQAGAKMHRKIQKRMGPEYHAEVPLRIILEEERYELVVEGRADGIIYGENDAVTIDEIKGMYMDFTNLTEPIGVHRAQAMCYAYIYAVQHDLKQVGIQMTYCNLDTEEIRRFQETIVFEELEIWFLHLIAAYKKWADFSYDWKKIRQASIQELEFPYPYRKGQKKLVADVYRTIRRKKNLFIQAPTGVGKTISTVFPAVRAVGEDLADKIFYLTAKTITGNVARETIGLLMEHGYQAKTAMITAKEKLCKCEEVDCNPESCPYAKGHFDRVNDAVYDLLQYENMYTRDVFFEQAEKFKVCPFELCLDTASWVDNIICDYNYVFDPNVYLKRFFAEGLKGDYIFLVDEAHNLVERGREMYSAVIYKEDFLAVRKIIKNHNRRLEQELSKCNQIMLHYKRSCDNYEILPDVGDLIFALMRLGAEMDKFFQKSSEFAGKEECLQLYFDVRNFLNIYDRVDENYVIYSKHDKEGRFFVKLYCVDPSRNLQECLDKGNSTIFFSATFLPITYYKRLLSTKEDNYAVYAETTFQKEQSLLVVASDVTSKYTRRNETEFAKIAEYIKKVTAARRGNYIVFFPSYQYMDQVAEVFERLNEEEAECLMQTSGMREKEREEFLAEFEKQREKSLIAFCVMGGIFGEGIDLKNDRLIGTLVVGTGLPQLSDEREILKDYYDRREGDGFSYAYRYPGMNKVQQAAGRVIRTAEDVGVIALLDERFLNRDYRELFPREWEQYEVCSLRNVEKCVAHFWEEKDETSDLRKKL